jgi:arylsulfatase
MSRPDRPHVVFILTDQQRYDTIAALGHPWMHTPHLDRLVREGVSFDRCYITSPSCVPSRASLFNGHYPHTTGILNNSEPWSRTWVADLAAAGYHCVNVGKMHTLPFEAPAGFHERYVVENKDRYLDGRYYFDRWDLALAARRLVKPQRELYRRRPDYREALGAFTWDLPPEMHSDNFVADTACWWLEHHPVDRPLFLQVGFPGPHPPYDPTPDHLARYAGAPLPVQPVDPAELAAQPSPLLTLREHNVRIDHDSVVHIEQPTAAQRQRQRAHYCANVSLIDAAVGRLLATLERRGLLEDTLLVFTSDHGDALGDHGHIQKWCLYESVVRVPAVVWSADGRFGRGRRIDELVQLFDFGPTVLEWAGLTPPATWAARSLNPLLQRQPGATGRDAVFAEHSRDSLFEGAALMSMVRTRDWKLVHYLEPDCGQLFDLRADPGEEHDQWNEPTAAAIRRTLLDRLRDWHLATAVQAARHHAPAR